MSRFAGMYVCIIAGDALFLRFQYTVREGKKFKHNFAAFAPQVNSLPKVTCNYDFAFITPIECPTCFTHMSVHIANPFNCVIGFTRLLLEC